MLSGGPLNFEFMPVEDDMKIYQDETAIREEFEREIKPKLLRYIFSAISKAMFIKDKVREGKKKTFIHFDRWRIPTSSSYLNCMAIAAGWL